MLSKVKLKNFLSVYEEVVEHGISLAAAADNEDQGDISTCSFEFCYDNVVICYEIYFMGNFETCSISIDLEDFYSFDYEAIREKYAKRRAAEAKKLEERRKAELDNKANQEYQREINQLISLMRKYPEVVGTIV